MEILKRKWYKNCQDFGLLHHVIQKKYQFRNFKDQLFTLSISFIMDQEFKKGAFCYESVKKVKTFPVDI